MHITNYYNLNGEDKADKVQFREHKSEIDKVI